MYTATILRAKPGKRLAKRYRDPDQRPDDYDAGHLFQAEERTWPTFEAFAQALTRLKPNECLIRGAVKEEARVDVEAGLYVRRIEFDKGADDKIGACHAAFEPAARNWIVLDLDECDHPLLHDAIGESIDFWRESLPKDIRDAKSAFFLSASAHRGGSLRGKLLVALAEPLDNAQAEAWAKAHGFDGSVCRTVQPNYFAAPVFEGCRDPLEGKRHAWLLQGKPARLKAAPIATTPKAKALGEREAAPVDATEATERVLELAIALADRWLEGDRVEGNAWLHLAGWLLGKGWPKAEVASLLRELDAFEPDARKRAEHRHILDNARPIEGLGGAREWLGDDLTRIDRLVNADPIGDAIAERRARRSYHAPDAGDVDPWDDDTDFAGEDEPLEYACEGLRLAPSKGKISIIAGNAGGGKGPIADHLAVCFALGLKAFGVHECQPSKVLLIDYEGRRLTKRRLMRMARAMGRQPSELAGRVHHIDASATGPALAEANLDAIRRRVEQDAIEVVILDSYTTAMLGSGIESNSPQYSELAQALGRLGVVVIAVAHAAKAHARDGTPYLTDIAGSGALGALAQTAIMVHYPDEADKYRVAVTCARAPETPCEAFEIRFADTPAGDLAVTVVAPEAIEDRGPGSVVAAIKDRLAKVGTDADAIEDALREIDTMATGVSVKKIRDACGLGQRAYAAALRECQRRQSVALASLPSDRDVRLRLVGAEPLKDAAPVLPKPGQRAGKSRASP